MILKIHSQKEVLSTTSQKVDTNQKHTFKSGIIAIVVGLALTPSLANAFDIKVPKGWLAKTTRANIHIYQKDPASRPRFSNEVTYVQILDIAGGGSVRLMQWKATEPRYKTKEHEHNFQYWRNSAETWKKEFERNSRYGEVPNSIVNGAFFMTNGGNPTYISFPIIVDGDNVENGESTGRFQSNQLRIMKFDSNNPNRNFPRVTDFTWNGLLSDDVKNAIVGHNPFTTNKENHKPDPRTFLCVAPISGGKKGLVVYTSTERKVADVVTDLQSWGCLNSTMVMLDGGKSVQFSAIGLPTIDHGRTVPQVIGLFN